ncbi:MAG TPA: hypothetical protein DDX85_14020 [Nitrospiraceae bacterium]|nr:hypothetical protein [Nitrospiraceae bacterium]
MKVKKIVARFRDGSLLKGTTVDFSPEGASFHVRSLSGQVSEVEVDKLKAVFFVKDFKGDTHRKDEYKDLRLWEGNKIQVHFKDGEIIIGYTLNYDINHRGFFMTPADVQSNNDEVFVIVSATEKLTFM